MSSISNEPRNTRITIYFLCRCVTDENTDARNMMIAVIDGTKDTLTAAGNKRRVLLAFVVLVKRLRARQLAL